MSMQAEAEVELTRHLDSDERLLWSGAPGGGLRLRRSDIFMIPFSILWGGFAIFWESLALRHNAPLFFLVWGLPFVALGLQMMVGRFFWDAFAASCQRQSRVVLLY